jgi:hypothetical protein
MIVEVLYYKHKNRVLNSPLFHGGVIMKASLKILFVLSALLILSSCAGGTIKLNEKYILDNQLEQVDKIYKYILTDWDRIDSQSFILEAGPGKYYLIILKIPALELPFKNGISISTTGDSIRAGLDELIIYNSGLESSYPIDRIYKFKDTQQMRAIRDQLTGKTGTQNKAPRAENAKKIKMQNGKSSEI